jgi:hypothetical protein
MAADYLLFLFDCFVNVILSILTVFLTCFLISRSDEVTDLVLNCLAITFIVELDEDLNHLDPVEVNDLVIQSFKKYLIDDMMRECKSKQSSNSDVADTSQLTLVKDNNVLISADYSSNPASTKVNLEVLEIVKKYIASNKLLPVLNSSFRYDPHPGKPKFLVLHFKVGDEKFITINVREKLVADFTVMEEMLRKNLVEGATTTPTPKKRRQLVHTYMLTYIHTYILHTHTNIHTYICVV